MTELGVFANGVESSENIGSLINFSGVYAHFVKSHSSLCFDLISVDFAITCDLNQRLIFLLSNNIKGIG